MTNSSALSVGWLPLAVTGLHFGPMLEQEFVELLGSEGSEAVTQFDAWADVGGFALSVDEELHDVVEFILWDADQQRFCQLTFGHDVPRSSRSFLRTQVTRDTECGMRSYREKVSYI
jgi:hypothetical protein